MQIVNVTTPANFFHVLRRQVSTVNRFFFSGQRAETHKVNGVGTGWTKGVKNQLLFQHNSPSSEDIETPYTGE